MSKITKNLSLDADAVERGERYSRVHGTNLSRLVSDFLLRLPPDESSGDLSPTVRRLFGVAATGPQNVDADEAYHDHLLAKYGAR